MSLRHTKKWKGNLSHETCENATKEIKFYWNVLNFAARKNHFQKVDLFSFYSQFLFRSLIYIVSQYAILLCSTGFVPEICFFTTTKVGQNISRDGIVVWVCMCILNQFQCHSIFLIGLNESCFFTFLIPEIQKLCAPRKVRRILVFVWCIALC